MKKDALHLKSMYHTRAIISRGLYIFYSIFHSGLYSKAVNITDNLCTKQGNSSIFGPIKTAVYNQERLQIKGYIIMRRVR